MPATSAGRSDSQSVAPPPPAAWCGLAPPPFVQTYDIWFRHIFAFFIINVGTREVVHVSATRAPTQQWTAQQRRNATLFGRNRVSSSATNATG